MNPYRLVLPNTLFKRPTLSRLIYCNHPRQSLQTKLTRTFE